MDSSDAVTGLEGLLSEIAMDPAPDDATTRYRLLREVIREGDAEALKELLANGDDVNFTPVAQVVPQDERYFSLLIMACLNAVTVDSWGHSAELRSTFVDIVKMLIAARADVNQGQYGYYPLAVSSNSTNTSLVSLLIAAQASVNQPDDDGQTALAVASGHDRNEVVATLIAANADVNFKGVDADALTPLLYACDRGHTDIVTKLLAAGADVDEPDGNNATPLIVACEGGYIDIAAKLLDANADINHQEDQGGRSALYAASKNGHSDIVEVLLASGADVEAKDFEGWTPIGAACCSVPASLICVQLLSSYGASRKLDVFGPFDTWEMEMAATSHGQHHIARWLKESRNYTSALQHLEVLTPARARSLLRAGADIDKEERGSTPRIRSTTPRNLAGALRKAGGVGPSRAVADMIYDASKRWSRQTHQYFPAVARARAVELMLIGELLSREERFAAYGPQAVVDAWMTFVVPTAVSRLSVQVVGLKGRADLNGQTGTIGEFNEAKGRYPVRLEGGESVLIKTTNLVSIGDKKSAVDDETHEEKLRVLYAAAARINALRRKNASR